METPRKNKSAPPPDLDLPENGIGDRRKRLGLTPLHMAVSNGNGEFVADYLEGEGKKDLNAQTNSGETPLHLAVSWNHPEIVRTLLEAEADTEIRDTLDKTPLMAAARYGKLECARILLKGNARIEAETPEDIRRETTPLLCAIEGEDNPDCLKIVSLLLEKGATRITAEELQAARESASQLKRDDIIDLLAKAPASTLASEGSQFVRGETTTETHRSVN
ncbi:MAG: ankyrin repeat domain-containing protein [bacterium]